MKSFSAKWDPFCGSELAPGGIMGRHARRLADNDHSTGARFLLALGLSLMIASTAFGADDLTELSLEDLMNVEITSVSKKAQSKTEAASAISVITSEDLRRGGFTSVPEALRVVPGIQVARIDANRWAISARGLNQEFANKLLVLIDGRTVYTPLFGGVYWDAQDYPIEDIERIEVIRGPGGTVWGDNAVNGVINVITKSSADTQGVLVSGYGGPQENGATGRFGGRINDETTYRVFGKGFKYEEHDVDRYHDGKDSWNSIHAGGRLDSQLTERDQLMVSADYFMVNEDRGVLDLVGADFDRRNDESQGGNVLAKWTRQLGDSGAISTKAYYDRTYRDANIEEDRHTADVEFQHDVSFNEEGEVGVQLTWGLNYRFSTSHINGIPTQSFRDNDDDFHLGGGFLQTQLDFLDDRVSLIAGIKLGGNNWSGFEYQPSGRLVVKPAEGHTLWAAVSRAVRTPTQLDRELRAAIAIPTPPFVVNLLGNRGQRSEDLLAIEAGYRFFDWEKATAEISVFHQRYQNLTSLQGGAPFTFDNQGDAQTTGGEIEINLKPFEWWHLTLGYAVLEMETDVPSNPLAGTEPSRAYPQSQVVVRSFFDLPAGFELDASLYYVDGLKGVVPARIPPTAQNVRQYVRLDLRIGYQPTDWLSIDLVGQNLTDRRHYEFNDVQSNQATQVPRSGYARVTLNF